MSSHSLLQTNNTLNTLNNTVDGQYLASGNHGSEVRLVGSHFQNPLFVAPIVINAICAAGFLILTIYSWVRGFSAKESRKAFIVMMSLLGGMTLSVVLPSQHTLFTCAMARIKSLEDSLHCTHHDFSPLRPTQV